MRFLIVNDDGIEADGIKRLARAAAEYGELWIVAPATQRSAASQSITLGRAFEVKKSDFPVSCAGAFAVDGTPADCVRMGIDFLLPERPDFVLSGVNDGLNTGYDCAYSATVGAAMEGIFNDVPSIAFSTEAGKPNEPEERYISEILGELISRQPIEDALWNVNFPGGAAEACRGVLYDREVAHSPVYCDHYKAEGETDGGVLVMAHGTMMPTEELPEGSDIRAVREGYVSVGAVYMVAAASRRRA